MKKKMLTGILAAFLIAGGIYALATQEKGPRAIDPVNVVTKTVNMSGMTCRSCEIAIEKVSEKPGVVKIKASSAEQKAVIEYDKTQTDIKTIMKAIEMKGFTPVSYEDETGLHEQNTSKTETTEHEMKCGSGKCGTK